MYVSGGKKCLFFGKFDLLCCLETPVLRFAFCRISNELSGNCMKENLNMRSLVLPASCEDNFPAQSKSFDLKKWSHDISTAIYIDYWPIVKGEYLIDREK